MSIPQRNFIAASLGQSSTLLLRKSGCLMRHLVYDLKRVLNPVNCWPAFSPINWPTTVRPSPPNNGVGPWSNPFTLSGLSLPFPTMNTISETEHTRLAQWFLIEPSERMGCLVSLPPANGLWPSRPPASQGSDIMAQSKTQGAVAVGPARY